MCVGEEMVHPERFERPTPRFVVWCSIQLSYGCPVIRRVGAKQCGPAKEARNLVRDLRLCKGRNGQNRGLRHAPKALTPIASTVNGLILAVIRAES